MFFFAALYCSCLGFNALIAIPTKEGGNKGIKNCLTLFEGKIPVNKLCVEMIYCGLINAGFGFEGRIRLGVDKITFISVQK